MGAAPDKKTAIRELIELGKSKGQLDFPIYFEDHPRVCGEKSGSLTVARAITGSPPRVRGKVFLRFVPRGRTGITPACAGKRLLLGHTRPG